MLKHSAEEEKNENMKHEHRSPCLLVDFWTKTQDNSAFRYRKPDLPEGIQERENDVR